jgi:hypothetical protein
VYSELEPNDSKTAANAFTLMPGDAIQGVSTGSTGVGLDYFRVKTTYLPLGVYRHQLVITSTTAGHTGTIRGLTQSAGVINPTSDATVQTSPTTPSRFNQWYGFGKEEEIYYRVTGTTSTTAPYLSTLSTTPVTVVQVPGAFVPGSITITTAGQGHSTDTDMWVYDANLNAIAGYGNDDAFGQTYSMSTLTRTYAPGDYYLALSNWNVANNLASPTDDDYRSGNVMDFANSAAQSSTTAGLNMQFSITDATGVPVVVANTKAAAFDINWFKFTVISPSTGACCYPNGHCVVTTEAGCPAPATFHPGATCGTVLPAEYHYEFPVNLPIDPFGLWFENEQHEEDSTPIGKVRIDLHIVGILGPLHIEIEHLGTTVVLWNGVCTSSDSMDVVFDDDGGTLNCFNLLGGVAIRPNNAGGGLLSDFRGMEAGGPWIIRIYRIYGDPNPIILVRWSLWVQFLDQTFVCVPVPMGSCCLPDGSCAHLSQADCTAQGGSQWQYAVPCSFRNCPQPQPGDNCYVPLPAGIFGPGSDPFDGDVTSCGHVNDYSNTCLGSYDGGEDVIYELEVTELVCLDITVTGATSGDNWIGVLLDDSCPPDPTTCLAKATSGSGTVAQITGVDLPVGTYWIMIDTYPAPNCINGHMVIMPCPVGACCLNTGVCLPHLTQAQCTTAGGIEWHVNEECLPTNPCPQPPVNDDCPNAIEVLDGTPAATGNNRLASTTDWLEASCQSNSNKDVWYAYTAPCTGAVVMDTEGSAQSDTVLSVYATCAGPEIACDDDSGTGLLSSLSFEATACTTYYVRVASYSTGSGGFNLNIAPQIGNCVTVTTDKDCYAPGEHVTVTITNNSCGAISLLNSSPWQIRDAGNNLVYQPACVFWLVIQLNSGESLTFTTGGGTNDGTTWDQLDDGDGQVGCGYKNRAQVANGTYQACVTYSAGGGQSTACTTFKIANNCVAVDPDCFCNMPGAPARIVIRNDGTEPVLLPNLQPWRIKNLLGEVVYSPTPSGSPFMLNPGQSYPVYWDQNDSYGQLAPSGTYIAEFDWTELPNTPHLAHGGLQLGGCLRLTLDQDCYSPGEVVTAKAVNTACQQVYLTLCDVGPILVKDNDGDTVWTYPCDTACNASRIMQSGEIRTWTWNQKDDGDGTHSNCESWNNANQVPNGHYCAQVPYADVNFLRGFTAERCLDIGADCADLTADKDCYETGDQTCFTLSNNSGGAITVDRPWRILDASGNEVHPGAGCFIFWIPIVIADGSCRQFCWDQQVCFTPPLVAPGDYTFEVHFTEADGTAHTYLQDFQILAVGGCTPAPPDCNHNSTPDSQDIAEGTSLDCDANGVPDECEYPGCLGLLIGDMTCDGKVDGRDISKFLEYLVALRYTCQADVNQDGAVSMLDVQPLVNLLLCWPNCPLTGPSVRSDQVCYLSGQSVVVHVDMPVTTAGSLDFLLLQEADDGSGTVVYEETRPLNGSSTYTFSAVLPAVGMYDAVARWLGTGGEEEGVDGVRLGARPALPQIPSEVCTFETFTLNASALRSQVEAAVADQTPMLLSIGSRSFEVLLQSANDIVDPEEFIKEPTLALFRGRITCNPNSEVRLTFIHGLVNAMVDQGVEQWGVYLEPSYQHDPSLPFDLYLGYRSDHVRIPMWPHEPLSSGEKDSANPPSAPEGLASAAASDADGLTGPRSGGSPRGTRCLRFNVYYDNDPSGTRYTTWSNIAGTFLNRFGTLSSVSAAFTQINTNAYADPTASYCNAGLFKSFRDAVGAVPAGYDVDVLFTANSANISYGNTLGESGWRRNAYGGASWSCAGGGDPKSAHCWVRSDGSTYRTRIVGCHEISHALGASDTTSAHRDGVMRTQCDVWGPLHIVCWSSHNVYSIMCSAYYGDNAADANWFDSDKTSLRNVIENTAGHFGNP